MLRELTVVVFCVVLIHVTDVQCEQSYTVLKNPPGYGSYRCPRNYERLDMDYGSRRHWAFMQYGSNDNPHCALKDTNARCKISNTNRNKFWMTFASVGWADFHISKYDHFSNVNSGISSDTSINSTYPTSSTSQIPQYFAVRALYFKVRGAFEVGVMFSGDITTTVNIAGNAIDWRKKTWICIRWNTQPIFYSVWLTLRFNRRRKVKLWEMYMFSCCEILGDAIIIDKKKK